MVCWYQMSRTNESVDMNYISECLEQSNSCTQETAYSQDQCTARFGIWWRLIPGSLRLFSLCPHIREVSKAIWGLFYEALTPFSIMSLHPQDPITSQRSHLLKPMRELGSSYTLGVDTETAINPYQRMRKWLEGDRGRHISVGSRLAWSIYWFHASQGLYSQTLSREKERRQRQTDRQDRQKLRSIWFLAGSRPNHQT